jgi:hypothetical protein
MDIILEIESMLI